MQMRILTKGIVSLVIAAVLPMVAQSSYAAPTRYYVPANRTTAKKAVAQRPVIWEVKSRNARAKSASPRAAKTAHKHANYQRRVPSGTRGNGDYLAQVGGNSRWAPGKTIKVYVAPGKSSYKNIVVSAMNQWSRATGGAFNWTLTGNPGSADYTIGWTSRQHEVSAGTEAGLTTTDTIVNPYTGQETIDHAHTRVLTRYNGRQLSDREVAETTLHEIGHALGLEGHSSNPRDIMFYAATKSQGGLTARDMNTISRLYQR